MGNKIIAKYLNGNVKVTLFNDGTKISKTDDDEFRPEFAECIDVTLSERCSHNCGFCYANCTTDGVIADLRIGSPIYEILDTIPSGTEIAVNINSDIQYGFEDFLRHMHERNVFVNVTVRQDDFVKNQELFRYWYNENLIWGIGVSLIEPTKNFIRLAQSFPTIVIHVIAGVIGSQQMECLADHELKILVLGYKHVGRGATYYGDDVVNKIKWLRNNLPEYVDRFDVMSFDNLALEQLDVRRLLTDKEWSVFYQGDEGTSTFFMNLAEGYFARDSLTKEHYLLGNNVVDMFKEIAYVHHH